MHSDLWSVRSGSGGRGERRRQASREAEEGRSYGGGGRVEAEGRRSLDSRL